MRDKGVQPIRLAAWALTALAAVVLTAARRGLLRGPRPGSLPARGLSGAEIWLDTVLACVLAVTAAALDMLSVEVALLSALVAVQTLGDGQAIVVDARIPAVLVAAGLLLLRAPFLVVVVAAALTAALLRLWGWAA